MIQPKLNDFSEGLFLSPLAYQNLEGTFKICIEQLEGPVYKMVPSGAMNEESARETVNLLTQVIAQTHLQAPNSVWLILDNFQLLGNAAEANKYLFQQIDGYFQTGSISQVAIVLPNPFVRILAKGKHLFSKKINLTFHPTYSEALAKVRANLQLHINVQCQKQTLLDKAERAGHKELLQMYAQLVEENAGIKAHQQQRVAELHEIIGRLTWDDTFSPQHIAIERNDPFSDVFNALFILQEDVCEMMREMKSLNLDLETQIVERTRELAEKEAKLSSLIENTSDLLLSVDRRGSVLVINSPCKIYFESAFQQEVDSGANLRKILPNKVVAYWTEKFERVFQGETFKETKHDWLGGGEVVWEISFNPIRDGRGKVIGASVFSKDITRQKNIADKIAENEQLLDNIYNTAAIGIALIEENGLFMRVNKTYCRMYGYEEEELLGQPITLVVPSAQQTTARAHLEHFMKTGKGSSAIRKDVCKNGKCINVLVTASRYTGEGGKVYGVFTVVDITEKIAAEEAIRENQKALSDAHKIARLGGWEFNIHTGELVFTPESLHVIGVEAKDNEDRYISLDDFLGHIVYPEDVELIKRHIKKAKRNQNHSHYRDSFEYRLVREDGKIFNIISHLRFKDNKNGIIYGISQDITDRKKVVEKLKKQNSELKKVNNELDRFVYRVSHDLRSPLTSVLGLIQVIKQETELSKVMHLLDLQEKSINKLDNFIKDIIDLSKNSRIELVREEVHFKEMIENIFEEQSFNKNADKIKKSIEIQQTVPFFSDARRISVVFNNLISNAIRYANPQQEHPFISILVQIKPNCATITVKDNGLGIEEEHHQKIFEMFYRASDIISGSGLGLYIVQETLGKLNGTIEVKSVSRQGTTFFLSIPNLSDRKISNLPGEP